MSLQKVNTKRFKSPFNNPLKHNAKIHQPERWMPSQKHEDSRQDKAMEKVPPIAANKSNIRKTATSNTRIPEKNLNKEGKKEERKILTMTSLTDKEYDEIFSSAINRALTGGIPSPVMEHNTGSNFDEDEIENRAAVPEPNEAQPPQEVAGRQMAYIKKEVRTGKGKTAQALSADTCVSEITPIKDSFGFEKTNLQDIQGVTKEKKVPLSTKKSSLPVLPKDQKSLRVQGQMNISNQKHYKNHTNAHMNLKTACKDTNTIPKMKKMQVNQAPKPQDNSFLQNSAFNEHESRVKDSSQISQCSSLQNQSGSHSKHSTQCSHNSHGCGHVCKRKHNHDCNNLTQDSNIHQDSIILKYGSQSHCSQTVLSQPGPELSLKERLLWLQKRRDVGLWVQCSSPVCKKWRYLHDTRDPVEVPRDWFCHLNSDKKYNSCAAPEKPPTPLEEDDLIHNIYTAGSVVWGRLAGFPWWPAMVDDDPDTEQYYWLNSFSDIPTHYNVVFFDEKDVTRAWLTPGAMRPFTGQENSKEFKKTISHGVDYAKRIQVARIQAQKALPMGIGERLRTFGFLARYKGSIGTIKKRQQDRKKSVKDEETFSQNNDEDEALVLYRDLQEEKGKRKPKRKRAKQDNILEPAAKKIRVQAADNEGKERTSEAINKIHKIDSNEVFEKKSNQTTFSSSLYTQELSNKETGSLKEKSFTDAKVKPLQNKSNNDGSQKGSTRQAEADSFPTKPEDMSLPKCKLNTSNERNKLTDEMHTLSDMESETQLSVASKQGENLINCSQDLFSSQNGNTEQPTSVKKRDTNNSSRTIAELSKSSTSEGLDSRNVNTPHKENKTGEIKVYSYMAAVGDTNKVGKIGTTNSVMRILEEGADNMMERGGDVTDNVSAVREFNIPTQSVLQPGISNTSTSNAPADSYSHCSQSVPLVPDSQFQRDEFQSVHKNCDAVVPQLDVEVSDNNSYSSADFEPEE